ncbi:hypothetical protein P7C70_g2795, partial [Phenoliferia sp. Uapishka_3]
MRSSLLILSTFFAIALANPNPEPAPTPCAGHDHSSKTPVKHAKSKSDGKHAKAPRVSKKSKTKSKPSKSKVAAAAVPLFSSTAVKTKAVPKVDKPSSSTLNKGAAEAIGQFTNSSYIPKAVGSKLAGALQSAINKQLASPTASTVTIRETVVSSVVRTSTKFATTTVKVNNAQATPSVVTVHDVVTDVVTETITAPGSTQSGSSSTDVAALDIKAAIDSAFAAVNLTESDLKNTTVQALEACLTTVLASGGLPSGYACLTSSGSNSAGLQATLNTVLEQFLGILPNKILDAMFSSVMPTLTSLLPSSEAALIAEIQASIKSVIATLSGSSVTALEQASTCYTNAIAQQGNTSALACYNSGAGSTLHTASNAVIESFVGVLPASLVTTVQNIINFNLANSTVGATGSSALAGEVQAQISNAINSAASTLSGNLVSTAETLQGCATLLLSSGNATAAQECVTKGSAPELSMTIILGLTEQFQGMTLSSPANLKHEFLSFFHFL